MPVETWGLEDKGHVGNISIESGRASGVFVRKMLFGRAGDHITGHVHAFDHMSVVAAGAVRCEVDGEDPVEIRAPRMLNIKAGRVHKFTALEDDTIVLCVHMAEPGERIAWKPDTAPTTG